LCVLGPLVNVAVENSFTQPLLMKSEAKQQDEDGDGECDDAEEDSGKIHKPVASIVAAYRLLTPSVKVLNFPFTY
jgi:hypothetical protein